MQYKFKVHSKNKAYQGFFNIDRYEVSYESFQGGEIGPVIRECGGNGDIVAVLAFDPKRRCFLLVEQFRIGMMVRGVHPWTREIIAGFMDVAHENAEMTAKRELLEETGCQALHLLPLVDYYPGSGGSATQNHVFLAIVDSTQKTPFTGILEEGEDIRVTELMLDSIWYGENPERMLIKRLQAEQVNSATALIAFQSFFSQFELDKHPLLQAN